MRKRTLLVAVAAVVALAGAGAYSQGIRSVEEAGAFLRNFSSLESAAAWARGLWTSPTTVAQPADPRAARIVPVEVATVTRAKVPVQLHGLGTVTPIAAVAIKPRLESTVTGVHFADGAMVRQGDLLFTLDSRQIEAQIAQVEAMMARDKAQLEGAERDLRRFADLVAKGATPVTNLDNARTQVNVYQAAVKAAEAQLESLKVQLSYCTIRAPIDGRISAANVKVGNFVRPADTTPLATIIQTAPVYVSFTVPQNSLPDVRRALAAETATVEVRIPGEARHATGQVTMIENTVDPATGMVTIRATMPNEDEFLWPGTLVSADLLLRVEEAITVPSVAVQSGQAGTYVFVIRNEVAEVRPVKIARTVGQISVIAEGLSAGEQVATDGQLLLGNGTRVRVRSQRAGV